MDLLGNGSRDRGWEGVANLPVSNGLAAAESPVVGKPLQAGDHRDGEAGHTNKVTRGRFVRDAHAIDPKGRPSPFCAGRPEVRSTVFQGAANDGWRDVVGALLPCARAFPATLLDEVVQGSEAASWKADAARSVWDGAHRHPLVPEGCQRHARAQDPDHEPQATRLPGVAGESGSRHLTNKVELHPKFGRSLLIPICSCTLHMYSISSPGSLMLLVGEATTSHVRKGCHAHGRT